MRVISATTETVGLEQRVYGGSGCFSSFNSYISHSTATDFPGNSDGYVWLGTGSDRTKPRL